MTYALDGTIQAADYNGFVSTINGGWSTGTGDSGYGQPAFTTVSVGDPVRARPATVVAGTPPTWNTTPEWRTLINSINTMSEHQVGTTPIASGDFAVAGSLPVVGTSPTGIIDHATTVSTALTAVTGSPQRLNASVQGATSTLNSGATTSTWNNSATLTWTIDFGSNDYARFFFNAGGQIGLQMSHPAGVVFDIDQLISDICSDAGTVWFSSTNSGAITLAGITYNGITKVGGANPGGVTIPSVNNGFYGIAVSTNTLVFSQTSDFVYHGYGSSFLAYYIENDGAGLITIQALLDEVPNGSVVSTGTTGSLLIRYPSTTYLAQSWSTPTTNWSWTYQSQLATSWTDRGGPAGVQPVYGYSARGVYANGRYVVGGASGTISTSTDGINWTTYSAATIGWSGVGTFYGQSIVWTGTKFLAVSLNSLVAESASGTAWTSPANNLISSLVLGTTTLAYDGSTYVAGGFDGRLAYSTDGANWTLAAANIFGAGGDVWSVVWNGSKFVAIGGNVTSGFTSTSTDGITWTPAVNSFGTNRMMSLANQGSTLVAVGEGGKSYYSTDNGSTWTLTSLGHTNNAYTIIWDGSQFVCSGIDSAISTSPDGITWSYNTSLSSGTPGWSSTNDVGVLISNGNQIVAIDSNGTAQGYIATSP